MGIISDHRLSIPEEIFCLALPHRKHVIIEVKILLIKSFDTMQMHFNRIAIEGREIFVRNDILVENYLKILLIDPLRDLGRVRNHQIYISDEWHIHFDTSEKILEGSPVTETLLHDLHIGIFLIILLPHRIISIDICYDDIHI